MVIYIMSALAAICFSWLAQKNKSIQSPSDRVSYSKFSYGLFAVLSFLPLFFVSALRYDISFDYSYTYVPVYNAVAAGRDTHCESGYELLNRLIYYVFDNVDWVFIVTTFIFLLFTFCTIYSRSVLIPLSVFLLIGTRMYYMSFGEIRQYIVIAIFLYSIKYIEQNKWIKYAVMIGAAALIHTLALAYLPVYFLCKVKLSRRTYILTALIFFAITPLVQRIYKFFAQIFYSQYLNANYGTEHYSVVFICLTLFVFLLTILYYRRIPQTKRNMILMNLQLIAAVFSFATIGISESDRLLALFMYSSILLVPQIVQVEQNKYLHYALLALIVAVYSASAFFFLVVSSDYFLPYRTIFSK